MPSIASVDHSAGLQVDAAMVDSCATNSLEHGNQANMAQHSNNSKSRLEALPDELLMATFEQLVYDEDRPSWRRPGPGETDTATLRSLCVVSNRVKVIAQLYLFKKVYIKDTVTLSSLYHTIGRNEYLGGHIKEVVINLILDESESEWPQRDFEELQNDCLQHTSEVISDVSTYGEKRCDLIGILCCGLLSRAANTRNLTLELPCWPTDYERFLRYFECVRKLTRRTADRGAAVFLPRLKTLTMCSAVALKFQTFVDVLDLPSLRTLRFQSDDGEWWRLAPAAEPYNDWPNLGSQRWARRNITTLVLSHSEACQYDFEDIAQLFPSLENLEVDGSKYSDRLKIYFDRGSRRELSTSLGKLTALRTLKIDLHLDGSITNDVYNDITASLGPGKMLSLSQLPNLQQIEVPIYMFAHLGVSGLEETTAVPREVLPQSLKNMVLLGACKNERMTATCCTALKFLESLEDDLPCLPHLESVVLCPCHHIYSSNFSTAVTENQDDEEDEAPVISRLQAICASFSEQKVQFGLQEAWDRRPIDLKNLEDLEDSEE